MTTIWIGALTSYDYGGFEMAASCEEVALEWLREKHMHSQEIAVQMNKQYAERWICGPIEKSIDGWFFSDNVDTYSIRSVEVRDK